MPVTLSLAYGFRRSEALGLRWEDIDFGETRIVVCHTVVEGIEDGRRILVEKDTMKARASRRTVPLFKPVTAMLTTANLYAHLDPSLVDECGTGIKKI